MNVDDLPKHQNDRCSLQYHLWRLDERDRVMKCRCGAVHPADLERFLSAPLGGES